MNILKSHRLIPALMIAFMLQASFFPAWAGVCEEGYPLPELHTDQFRGEGRIDHIEEGHMVIEDRVFQLTPETEYFTHVMGRGSVHLFHEGMAVGFISNGEMEVLILWLKK
ncbi:MAG: hypothetical protein AVO35_13180 [Candidatus Aegiribacteria sp. MLS_C]|nr:MAG: hypothetical protein AVO35_13180 [Candidatus Aegiribacteria sp. MLS_C]